MDRASVLKPELSLEVEVPTAGHDWSPPTHTEVAELAYSYWEARGCQGGSPAEDWFRAEHELNTLREL